MISAVIHFIVITPLYSLDQDAFSERRPMVVDYLPQPETPQVQIEKGITETRTPETGRIILAKDIQGEPPAPSRSDDSRKQAELAAAAKAEPQIRATKGYNDYYQVLRERIREKLKENYKYYDNGGDIYLLFTLRSDGTVQTHDVDRARSASDDTLINIAKVSLIEAGPFPSFPKEMSVSKMSFSLIVSFKK